MAEKKNPTPLQPPATVRESAGKVARALEVRKSSSKAREGKPLGFPTRRMRP